jgi:folate-dependent phosphoribosylglycinamide formyltransferase PurN
MREGEGNDFSSFKSAVEKGIDTASLNEDMHDTLRGMVGYKKGQESSAIDKAAGKVLTDLGAANIYSMGFLPAITGAFLDQFAGTDILNTVAATIGSGSGAAALSVVAGLLGGAILWKLGKIMQNEKVTDSTPI